MNCANLVSLIFCACYASSQYLPVNHKPKSVCESSTKNALIEHFFNIIFTEFHTTPPVCVCVQMCAGQSTYCYPNGCLERDDLKRVDSPQATPHARGDRTPYMFVVDDKSDFMKDLLERAYADEAKTLPQVREPIQDMRPDVFKDKYSMLVKYKKMPSVKLRYNLREQVKNMKSDLLKIETVDLSKTRWPLNKRNLISGHKTRSKIEKRAPLVGKTNFFMAMQPANGYADYTPKYSKRDIAKILDADDTKAKAFYSLENLESTKEGKSSDISISLETLIDNLIKNSFKTKLDEKNNETKSNAVTEVTRINKTKVIAERKCDVVNQTSSANETVNVLSINFTNEKVDKNKYVDDSVFPTANKFNEMIMNLSKRIEKQNNTSMELAKRVVSNFDEQDTTLITDTETFNNEFNSTLAQNSIIENDETKTSDQETKSSTLANFKDNIVTKKIRQRRARKLQNSKNNSK